MRIDRQRTSPFPILLLEADEANAVQLASRLPAAGFEIRIEGRADSALQAQRQSFFSALIVIADLSDTDCLVMLDALRRRSPRTWMIVATSNCDAHACHAIRRHGGAPRDSRWLHLCGVSAQTTKVLANFGGADTRVE